eukprot:358332-Chlamydomonas_euryale.AAC.1
MTGCRIGRANKGPPKHGRRVAAPRLLLVAPAAVAAAAAAASATGAAADNPTSVYRSKSRRAFVRQCRRTRRVGIALVTWGGRRLHVVVAVVAEATPTLLPILPHNPSCQRGGAPPRHGGGVSRCAAQMTPAGQGVSLWKGPTIRTGGGKAPATISRLQTWTACQVVYKTQNTPWEIAMQDGPTAICVCSHVHRNQAGFQMVQMFEDPLTRPCKSRRQGHVQADPNWLCASVLCHMYMALSNYMTNMWYWVQKKFMPYHMKAGRHNLHGPQHAKNNAVLSLKIGKY